MTASSVPMASGSTEKEKEKEKEKLVVFDTTFRDIMQITPSSSSTLPLATLVDLASSIAQLNVDVIEAGFPVRSRADFEGVAAVAEALGRDFDRVRVAALARAVPTDVQRAYEALQKCPPHRRRIHIFSSCGGSGSTSDDPSTDVASKVDQVGNVVGMARRLCDDVQVSIEDAMTTSREAVLPFIVSAVRAGASSICISDSLGYSTPNEYGEAIRYFREAAESEVTEETASRLIWSCHCHNELGLATANTLQGILSGARQVEASVLGIGPKAGRAALDEVVLNIKARPRSYPVTTQVDISQLHRTGLKLEDITGISIYPLKPFLGKQAYMSEGGLHVPNIPSDPDIAASYNIISPQDVGVSTVSMPLGPHTDLSAFKTRLNSLGYSHLPEREQKMAFQRFKKVASVKRMVTDQDIGSIAGDLGTNEEESQVWKLVVTGTTALTTATVALLALSPTPPSASQPLVRIMTPPRPPTPKRLVHAAVSSNGAIDAVYNAIVHIVGIRINLLDFEIKSVGEGTDALGKVAVRICKDEDGLGARTDVLPTFIGHAVDVDIVVASALAFCQAISRLVRAGR